MDPAQNFLSEISVYIVQVGRNNHGGQIKIHIGAPFEHNGF